MIFHLFNFFIHLPPSFTSQTNLHLHRESASEAHRPLAGSMTSAKLSLLRVNPHSLCVAALLLQPGDRVGAVLRGGTRRQHSELSCRRRSGRRRGRTGGFFPGMKSWMMASLSARAELRDAPVSCYTHTHTHTKNSYHVDPQNHNKAFMKRLELSTGQ